jgi:hypothetical protein
MFRFARRVFLVIGVILLSLFLGGAALAQTAPECSQGEAPTGCIQIVLKPGQAVGDFYVDGVLSASGQNPGWLVLVPDVEHTIEIKNIQSSEQDFGTLFQYSDVPAFTFRVDAGGTKVKTIWLTRSYIRGMLKLACDIKNAASTDHVSCRTTIDDAVQPDVAAGQAASYALDPGNRHVRMEIVGEQASLFEPAFQDRTVKITAGPGFTSLRATFVKKGHLLLKLDQTGVVADFYVDGAQVAAQAATYEMWVSPNKNHRIEARQFADPAAGDTYTWRDARLSVSVRPGAERTVVFKLRKQYLKGFLVIKCNIANLPGAYCSPVFSGAEQAVVAAGTSAQYTLEPGTYDVVVAPGPAGSWRPASFTRRVTIRAGQAQTLTATFTAIPPTPTPLPPVNLIGNPGFEDGAVKETGDLTVPVGWHVWSSCSGVIHSELEAHPPQVRSGTFAARVWQSYNTCQMGFYQQVNVTSGKSYQFTAYGFSWSTGNPVVGSASQATMKMWIGIDPNGGANPLAASIVWSDPQAAMDAYGIFSISAVAKSGVITVVLRSAPDWGMARNDTFWDDTSLFMVK